MFLLAAAVGALGGLLGWGFQSLLGRFQLLGLGDPSGTSIADAARGLNAWQRVAVPAAGGLLAALCLLAVRGRRGPFGIADVMYLVISRRGVIKLRESLAQILSSACSISTGSSIGKESANTQLGATVGSALGRLFRRTSRERAVLLGCGVAAGMAVSYNAPIAGALFVMEVVLGNFAMDVFAPVVVSAVIATLIHRWVQPASTNALYAEGEVGAIHMSDPQLVAAALLLGGICGLGAIGFRRCLALGSEAFSRLRAPVWVALPIGGALVGAIGIGQPEVWGNGQNVVVGIIQAAPGYGAVEMLLTIMVLKSVATAISVGSGSLGGVFTPNLVVGAALGAVYAFGVDAFTSIDHLGLTSQQLRTGFALVGMAGLCAATTHAPITAILLVFEFTRNYDLILPVMSCSIIGSLVARMLDPDSIFTARLRDLGHMLAGGLEALAVQTNYVRDLMRRDDQSLLDTASFEEVMGVFATARRDTVFVVDRERRLLGRIHIHDVKYFINDPSLTSVVIAADLMHNARAVTPDQSLAEVFANFDDPDIGELPVVESLEAPRFVGRLTRRDVIALLSDEVLGQRNLRAKLRPEDGDEDTYVELPSGAVLARIDVPDAMVGRALDSLDLPGTAGVTALVVITTDAEGREQRALPDPRRILEPNTSLVVLGSHEAVESLRAVRS